MREILFKAKRIDNGEWAKGSLFAEGKITKIIRGTCNTIGIEGVDVNPETICQCTGLKDKNGKLIWENDVVRYTDMIIGAEKIDLIEWNETYASFVRLHRSKMGLQYLNINEFIANGCEVIGSIFDNPELLNE